MRENVRKKIILRLYYRTAGGKYEIDVVKYCKSSVNKRLTMPEGNSGGR